MRRFAPTLTLLSLLAARDAHPQAGLLVPTSSGRPDEAVLSLREMAIEVGIARGYARVNVLQVFENHTPAIQEGTYRFRLPPTAAVGDFAVWDDLVRIPGVILEKQRARAIYRELTTQRIDPGLLQQGEEEDRAPGSGGGPAARPSAGALFAVRVAPIPAWATKRLELQFQQDVPFIEGRGEFRLGLRPPDGEPPVAAKLTVRVRVEDGTFVPGTSNLPLQQDGADLVFSGKATPLDRDLVVRIAPRAQAPVRVTAFRNPDGTLPDGLALAPWERPSDIPPEKDGFFLLEVTPPAAAPRPEAAAPTPAAAPKRPAVTLAILFDTSLSHRWSGLETAYSHLVRVLQSLTPADRFVVIPFDRTPAAALALQPATPEAIEGALSLLRARPLAPGTDVARAVAAARALAGDGGRILLLTDGPADLSSRALQASRGRLPLFTALTGEEAPEAYRTASTHVLVPGAAEIEADLFFKRVVHPLEQVASARDRAQEPLPFRVAGGEPRLRDVYPILVQPLAAASLSAWIGRYATPQPQLRWEVSSPLVPQAQRSVDAPLPEKATDARDLPRRWARARVDYLLMRIEAEGERREWVDEIIALSKRYKFVTPYTAFLAAPRSLLRPRRIQPGDPVLRVECDPGIVSAVALFPFGLRLPLVKRPGTNLWEGRFLVPEGLPDGRYSVRILLADRGGARLTESKSFVLDGRAPVIRPEPLSPAHAGASLRIAVRSDEDVVLLSARLGEGPPVPLRWDDAAKRSIGVLRVPATAAGRQEIFFEAVDGAKNHGFARVALEVLP
jgi:Ca-activated chloride channel family protein